MIVKQKYCCLEFKRWVRIKKGIRHEFPSREVKEPSYLIEVLIPAYSKDWESILTNDDDTTMLKMKGDYMPKVMTIKHCPFCGSKLA